MAARSWDINTLAAASVILDHAPAGAAPARALAGAAPAAIRASAHLGGAHQRAAHPLATSSSSASLPSSAGPASSPSPASSASSASAPAAPAAPALPASSFPAPALAARPRAPRPASILRRACALCRRVLEKPQFSKTQWHELRVRSKCLDCIAARRRHDDEQARGLRERGAAREQVGG